MRNFEGRPGLQGYNYPEHHLVYKPDGSHAVDSMFPHGDAGYHQAVARVEELGGAAELRFAPSSWQYINTANKSDSFPWHEPLGDGVEHTSEDFISEDYDIDRIEIAKLEKLQAKHPDMEIAVDFGGKSFSVAQSLSHENKIHHNRYLSVASAEPFPHQKPLLPEDLATDQNMVVRVTQEKIGPTVSNRVKDEGQALFAILKYDQLKDDQELELKEVENTLGIEVDDVISTLAGGLAIYRQRTLIVDSRYKPRIPATHVGPYTGIFPRQFRSMLKAIEENRIQIS